MRNAKDQDKTVYTYVRWNDSENVVTVGKTKDPFGTLRRYGVIEVKDHNGFKYQTTNLVKLIEGDVVKDLMDSGVRVYVGKIDNMSRSKSQVFVFDKLITKLDSYVDVSNDVLTKHNVGKTLTWKNYKALMELRCKLTDEEWHGAIKALVDQYQ